MRVPTSQRSRQAKFNIISMIDIFFLLIIFFITATRFVHSESLQEIRLPQATGAEESAEDQAARILIVTITADRELLIGLEKVDLAAVEERILSGHERDPAGFEVRIRADRTVPYRDIEPISLACARAGVTNLKFAVFPK